MRPYLQALSEYAIALIDAMALVVVLYAAMEAFIQAVRLVILHNMMVQSQEVWLRFSRLLVAALTFQLAADIIETSVSTTGEALGRIAVIAFIRTFLNYFLEKDVRELREARET